MKLLIRSCLPLFLCFAFFSAIHAQDSSIIQNAPVQSKKDIIIKYGIASYYAKKFEGRKTYTDKIYDSKLLTAACNVLPMGTWVKVTNLRNDKSVVVEINDKLARTNKRLIDLTYRAAKDLGYISHGITRVKVEVLGDLKKQKKNQRLHKSRKKSHKSKQKSHKSKHTSHKH